jgi:hypothetical protein
LCLTAALLVLGQEVLEGMRHWKTTRVVPNVKNGDKIYESACGIGLNLIMTMEILNQHGIADVSLHGNVSRLFSAVAFAITHFLPIHNQEYLADSAELADRVLDELAPTFGGHKGSVCQADSTNLQHIPDNTFDLAFTGYLTTLYDPLDWNQTGEENKRRNSELCTFNMTNSSRDYQLYKLLEIAQERQGAWVGKWVGEMVRIAKPGKAVLIAQERESVCRNSPNFMGLSREWWKTAIIKYGWDVDPDSLDFEDDVIFTRQVRYHVFMRKNGGSL